MFICLICSCFFVGGLTAYPDISDPGGRLVADKMTTDSGRTIDILKKYTLQTESINGIYYKVYVVIGANHQQATDYTRPYFLLEEVEKTQEVNETDEETGETHTVNKTIKLDIDEVSQLGFEFRASLKGVLDTRKSVYTDDKAVALTQYNLGLTQGYYLTFEDPNGNTQGYNFLKKETKFVNFKMYKVDSKLLLRGGSGYYEKKVFDAFE